MGEAFTELLFWIVVFVVFFFGFRKLQNKKKQTNSDRSGKNISRQDSRPASDSDFGDGGGGDGD